jgi:hypothetical protein
MPFKTRAVPLTLALTVLCSSSASADVKRVAYAAVKVDIAQAFAPDASFQRMQKTFLDAATKKDQKALLSLIGPNFVWTSEGGISEQLDLGRDTLHNFKVLFGFRPSGATADGLVEGGPFLDSLLQFAKEKLHYRTAEDANLVCGPISAEIVDDVALEQAKRKISGDDADWVFPVAEATLTRTPSETAVVAKVKGVAVPVLNTFPAPVEGQEVVPSHYEVLLTSGRAGWVSAEDGP